MKLATAPRFAVPSLLLLIVLLAIYRVVSRELIDLGLHIDEARYFALSLDPLRAMFSEPPLAAWAIWGARAACGESPWCIRLPSVLAVSLATWFVFLTARRLFDTRIACWAALVFLLAPVVSVLSWFGTADALLLLTWSVALYAFVRAVHAPHPRQQFQWCLWTGLAAGVGLLTAHAMSVFAAGALGFLLTSRAQRRLLLTPGPYAGAVLAALIAAPSLADNVAQMQLQAGDWFAISLFASSWFDALQILAAQFIAFGPILLLVLIAAFVASAVAFTGSAPALRLLLWFAVPPLIAAAAAAPHAHTDSLRLLAAAAPSYVAASMIVSAWLLQRNRRGWLIVALALNVALTGAFNHYRLAVLARGSHLPDRLDPLRPLSGWNYLGQSVAAELERSNAQLVSDDADLAAMLVYYAGARARPVLLWSSQHAVQVDPGSLLFVSYRDRLSDLQRGFGRVESLGALSSSSCRHCLITLHLYKIDKRS